MAPIPELLVLVLLAVWSRPSNSARPGQEPPDPTLGMPWREWELGRDPYFNGSWIGLMYRPAGRLRRVTWLADGFGLERNDPPGWERRAVLTYGDDGNCTEVEDWTMGSRDSRRFLESPQRGHSTIITQDGDAATSHMTLFLRDSRDLVIASLFLPNPGEFVNAPLRTDWLPADLARGFVPLYVSAQYEYDSAGRLLEADFPMRRRHVEWYYDPEGRVRHVQESGEGSKSSTFGYDCEGRVRTREERFTGTTELETEYFYGANGLLIETCTRSGGAVIRTVTCEYEEGDRLVSRMTIESHPVPDHAGQPFIRTEERFDGIDKPLRHRVADAQGRWLETTTWSYELDDRGNWILKVPSGNSSDEEPAVMRVIEYAD